MLALFTISCFAIAAILIRRDGVQSEEDIRDIEDSDSWFSKD